MLDVHVVTHTHWDREWYHPYERFRQRLVELVDELIDDPPPPGESFLLDGQAIVLEDYLSVRPDRVATLQRLLTEGRIEAGPWYVLADELIPSGEALVRNLLAGLRVLRRFDAAAPPVLYCPDSFGHPAALPAIAHGFGLPLIVVWRGYGGVRWPAGDTVRWRAPNGDEALVFHLPRDGYEFGSHLPTDPAATGERWRRLRAELGARSSTGVLLVTHGADHHARQLDHQAALAALERTSTTDHIHRSSLRSFAEQVVDRSRNQHLPRIRGELRDSYGYTWTLQGTFASRAAEKRLNARAERALLRDAEPWAGLAWVARGRSRRALMDAAWRTLLTAHPHDTLCGTSVDHVADAMELRLHAATVQAHGIRDDAIADLLGHDAAVARERRESWRPMFVLRNRAPRARAGVALIDVREFVADVPVGPGSAFVESPPGAAAGKSSQGWPNGQVLSTDLAMDRVESPRHYPDNDLVRRTRVAVWVSSVPGYGLRCVPLDDAVGTPPPIRVTARGRRMHNGLLAVEISDDGAVTVVDEQSGRRLENILGFEDEVDLGDLYTASPRGIVGTAELTRIRVLHRGPVRGAMELRFRVTESVGRRRAVRANITVRLVLDAGASFVRVLTSGENLADDHRLRLVVRSDLANPTVVADAAFGPQQREHIDAALEDGAMETPPATAPLHRYVSLFDEARGITLFSDGLAEYEARDDGSVRITLVRAVGELSKNDLPERPGHAGWPTPTPRAQSHGPFEANFAVMPHGARVGATVDAVERAADDVLLPLVGGTLRSALSVPAPVIGAELEGSGLGFSALKESESGEWLVARCVNLTDETRQGRWRFGFPVSAAMVARLDENPVEELTVVDGGVAFEAAARGIVTILVR